MKKKPVQKIASFSRWFHKQFGMDSPTESLDVLYEKFKDAEFNLKEARLYHTMYEAAKKGWYGRP